MMVDKDRAHHQRPSCEGLEDRVRLKECLPECPRKTKVRWLVLAACVGGGSATALVVGSESGRTR